ELAVRIDLGGEGLVYDDSGNMLQGISSGSVFDSEFSRDLIHLGALPANRRNLRLWIEASACGLFGVHTEPDPLPTSPRRYGHFEAKVKTAELCRFDRERWSLWLDLETIRGVLTALPEASTRRSRLLVALAEALDLYGRTGSVTECRKLLAEEYNRPASDSELTSVAVGHAHIDTAWLWPVRESVRKCARTFASQLSLIDKYPDYVFGASQPQHYKFVKEHYPALYERISRAVNDGRWEVQGGMWVEADCNLISGESMIRQILHGKNFFRDEFGVDVNNLWLPDVFGYSPALPQILLKSGIQYFLTQKMSWNQYNKFPHHTFEWQGIDGSSVLAHFPPEDTYNSSLRAESLIRGAAQFRERGYLDRFMSLFGVGDGGGGPKEEHLEFGKRCKDVEGVPHVRFDKAESFFAEVEKDREKLPTWVGELYLELHRGTLTTQAQNKRWNRKLEYRIQDAEMLFSCLSLEDYPDSQLSGLWQTLLMNQFHDILPGSSITSVYSRSAEEYEQINGELDQLQAQAVGKMAEPDEDALLLFNPTSYRFEGTIALPSGWTSATAASSPAAPVSAQLEQSGVRAAVTVEPFEFITLKRSPESCKDVIEDERLLLENDLIRYEFDPDGRLLKVLDKEIGRFVSQADNPGNLLTLYEDRPNNWDAWDIDRTYERTAVASAVSEAPARRLRGPVRQTLQLQLGIGNTHIKQQIVLSHGSKRLDFQTAVDWQESHKMLRVAFPVNVRSDEASFDIQCGYVKRPTHRNTSWDLARFEVVAHRYADVSEPDYGVALLNDCKYGHRVLGSTLDLCLLRSPSYPDPDADRGAHEFTYALLPHQSDMVRSDVMAQASALNHPPLVRHGFGEHDTRVPVRIEGTGVVIQTLKKAEKESCLVLRLVETNGCRTTAALRCASDIIRVEECDLMEWNVIRDIRLSNNESITLDPFEVKTFKLWRK
ncbi:MAG: alpha-mannosidase, partial [bacterium]|nr:alpha-mannosidase [bacterium]